MKILMNLILFVSILFGAESVAPKEVIENIDFFKEFEFFLFMDLIEKEELEIDLTDKKSEKQDTELILSTKSLNVSTNNINIILSTDTGRNYEN